VDEALPGIAVGEFLLQYAEGLRHILAASDGLRGDRLQDYVPVEDFGVRGEVREDDVLSARYTSPERGLDL
jgi:hypothetical protein